MSDHKRRAVRNVDPETEEEYLTDSEGEGEQCGKETVAVGGTALVETVSKGPGTKPKLWLAAVDRKLFAIDRMMDRVAYWPSKPPTVEELEKARDARLQREADRQERVARRKEEREVSVYLFY